MGIESQIRQNGRSSELLSRGSHMLNSASRGKTTTSSVAEGRKAANQQQGTGCRSQAMRQRDARATKGASGHEITGESTPLVRQKVD